MKSGLLRPPTWCALGAVAFLASPAHAAGAPTRQYLDQAKTAAAQIQLAGDQSAALQSITAALVPLDPRAALEVAGRIRRPSDGARALGAVAIAVRADSPELADQTIADAGKLLLRIADPEQRSVEQRLLLREIAPLGEGALAGAPELGAGEAQFEVVVGLAHSDPVAALALLQKWQLGAGSADEALAAIAEEMAETDPDQALVVASGITSARWRDSTLWRIAERRPPVEAVDIALRVSDPVVRSGVQTSAAIRMAREDPDGAVEIARSVEVAPESALAEVAAAIAQSDAERALGVAQGLSARPRAWALRRLAVEAAATRPDLTQKLLADGGFDPATTRLAVARMATTDPPRALALARELPPGEARDGALAVLAPAIARSNAETASEILWEIQDPRWREKAVAPAVLALAPVDRDAATSLLGLVNDPAQAARIRAKMAVSLAAREPDAAARLLRTLPSSDYRSDAALAAAEAVLASGGQPDAAMQLGAAGMNSDLALRWAIPCLGQAQTRSPLDLADKIVDPYPQVLALVDLSRKMLGLEPQVKPAPERARQVRCISEWQGR